MERKKLERDREENDTQLITNIDPGKDLLSLHEEESFSDADGQLTASEQDAQVSSLMKKMDDGIWFCTECDYTSKEHSNLKDHIERHHIPGFSLKCEKCYKALKSSKAFQCHIKRCSDGGKRFKEIENDDGQLLVNKELDEKIATLMEKRDDGVWDCKECQYNSKDKSRVKGHVEKHTDGYFHPCKECSRVFKRRASLRCHPCGESKAEN